MLNLIKFKAGEVIIRENEVGESAYYIENGRVQVSRQKDNQIIHLAYITKGETFGEMSMIDEKPRSATVTAVEETLVSKIHRDDFFESLSRKPEASIPILSVLFERLREANMTIMQLKDGEVIETNNVQKEFPTKSEKTLPHITIEG